jgi:hypothetical protein
MEYSNTISTRKGKLAPVSSPAPIVMPTTAPALPAAEPPMSAEKAELLAQIAKLTQENAALKTTARSQTLSLRVSDKGGVSVYGLGKFPITLYWEQWEKLLALAEHIREFITANKHLLKSKESK